MTDDMKCGNCRADVHSIDVESISIVKWFPETESNVLLAIVCSTKCLAEWADSCVAEEEGSRLSLEMGEAEDAWHRKAYEEEKEARYLNG